MDRSGRVVRNSGVHAQELQQPPCLPEIPSAAAMVDMVVLSGDTLLFEAIRHAAGSRTAVRQAESAGESVELLLSGRCGVLVVDMAALSAEPASFVRQVLSQFPDVVVVAAGQREDEPVLASLISEGLIYRFMHKPISPRRARMFLDAAVRCHVDRRAGGTAEPLLPLGGKGRSRRDPRKWLFVGSGLAVLVAVLAAINVVRDSRTANAPPDARAAPSATVVPSPGPLADPVLARARAAFAAGRDEAPPGRNALDLYAAVLLARPDDAEARSGLEATAARLVAKAEDAARIGNRHEAQRLASRVLEASPGHPAARAVLAGLEPPVNRAPRVPGVTKAAPVPRVLPTTPPAGVPAQRDPAATSQGAPQGPSPAAGKRSNPGRVAGSSATRTAPAPAPTPRVRPDPLTPRIVSKPTATTTAGATQRRGTRSYGAPVSSGHPVAGYVTRRPEVAVAANSSAPIVATFDGERIVWRDLEALVLTDPVYPPHALRQRIEGWVEVEFTVSEQGATRDVDVVGAEPPGVFEAAATEAVAAWRFRPRIVNGLPTPQRSAVTLRFSVED